MSVGQIGSTMLSIATLAAFVLLLGGITILRRGDDRKRGWLMLGAALVLVINVLIWTL